MKMLKRSEKLKKIGARALCGAGIDGLGRYLNRQKLLVVVYHGITRQCYDPPIWTQLPVNVFDEQIQFLKGNYHLISMRELTRALEEKRDLPPRSAMVTFDDGLKNNYTVAFPILERYSLPATIFLTTDLIGTERFFWFDELYFIVRHGMMTALGNRSQKLPKEMSAGIAQEYIRRVEQLKRLSENERCEMLGQLKEEYSWNDSPPREDFGLLTWDNVREMDQSGFIDFGIHTATHAILSITPDQEWYREIRKPRKLLSDHLNKNIDSFCFPNGVPLVDFSDIHVQYLRKCGYLCAFTTQSDLWDGKDPFRIGRIPAGFDITSDGFFFRINTAGVIRFIKEMLGKHTEPGGIIYEN